MSHRLDLDRIEEAARVVDPVFLGTPQFVSEGLVEGVRVLLKVETANPIRSFKGRGAGYFVHRLRARAPLVCASAGNFGQGLAWAARARGMPLTIFAAVGASPLKVERMRRFGAEVRLGGEDFDAAKAAARTWAERAGATFVEDGREAAIAEGAGGMAVELLQWPEAPEALLVPVGNGALITGVARWVKAHSPETRVVGVSAAGAPAMERSWRTGAVVETDATDTIADGIAVRVPVAEALADMRGVVDEMVLVDDQAIVRAMRRTFEETGLVVEPAGAAGVAALVAAPERWRGRLVATPLCGSNITAEQARRWLLGG
ncbi:MAG TPA: pyridoxal-phosphate dependent enzyme [Longimicrobiales bacterium]|nr:pyridoxal-phosphate dependent enzyme [Longimicrobiales bacterium]